MEFTTKIKDINLTKEELALAQRLKISNRFMSLLVNRGIALEDIESYLHPSYKDLSSPFEIDGMDKAVNRIKKAILNKERILIYGDYDCDGICATSILMLYLKDKTDATYFIPSRFKNGYGLTKEAIAEITSRRKADLVITVDCGITAVEEVEYIKSLGMDVIITDHHEPQDEIPSCIVLDPKIKKTGFYDLCGAGVALRLVEALSSREESLKYFDICSIATIADVVPLHKDNRIIASIGLKQIEKNPRQGLKMLLGQEELSSQDVMFKLAPRMNSAGRLNTAMKVVELFLESDYFLLQSLTNELIRDNAKRQDLCEDVVNEALQMLKGIDLNKTRIITLYKENWESGVLGIAAARIVEEFRCPAILFSLQDGILKGSARSIPQVNIFELFSRHNEFFTSFGGHAQAAGLSLAVEHYEEFVEAINKDIIENVDYKSFLPKVECEMELPFDMDFISFAKELEYMEPTGYGNAKPNFLVRARDLKFERIGFTNHVKYKGKGIDLIGFTKYYGTLFPRTGSLELEITLGLNLYQNKYTAQGQIKSVNVLNIDLDEDDAICLNSHHLKYSGRDTMKHIDKESIDTMLQKHFGTLFVCFSKEDYLNLINKVPEIAKLPVYLCNTKFLNTENCVVVCPSDNFGYMQYQNVIVAGSPLSNGYLKHIEELSSSAYKFGTVLKKNLFITPDSLRNVFRAVTDVVNKDRHFRPQTRKQFYQAASSRHKMDEWLFYIAMDIFEELGLIKILERGYVEISNKKVDLEDSKIYLNVSGRD